MSKTYGVVNVLSSFGFCIWWRHQCLSLVNFPKQCVVYDLMSGMGELWPGIIKRSPDAKITAVDLSAGMCAHAEIRAKHLESKFGNEITIVQADILRSEIAANSADVVVVSFGLKTFSIVQLEALAAEVSRILKPRGQFAFVEISVPRHSLLRWPYMQYVGRVIPIIGWLLLGNPDNYRMLGVYTAAFGNCDSFSDCLRRERLSVNQKSLFFGCAGAVYGCKPQ